MKREFIRWVLLLSGACIGLVIGVLHGYLFYLFKGPFKQDSFMADSMILASCTTFISVIYNTGIYGYKILDDKNEFEELDKKKKLHMRLLNITTVLFLIAAWVYPGQ